MCIELIKALATPAIGGGVALWIAYWIYPWQKTIDRQSAVQSEMRKVHADYLACILGLNSGPTKYAEVEAQPPEVVAERLRLFTLLQAIQLYAPVDVYEKAKALFDADADELSAKRKLHILSSAGGAGLENAMESSYEKERLFQPALKNYLEAVRESHKSDIGMKHKSAAALR